MSNQPSFEATGLALWSVTEDEKKEVSLRDIEMLIKEYFFQQNDAVEIGLTYSHISDILEREHTTRLDAFDRAEEFH
jgi:hypothetical protein